jgi:hypothetical protein
VIKRHGGRGPVPEWLRRTIQAGLAGFNAGAAQSGEPSKATALLRRFQRRCAGAFIIPQGSPARTAQRKPALHPSIIRNAALDYDRMVPVVAATLRAALFAQRTDDLISDAYAVTSVIGPAGLPVLQSANVGSSDAVGIELAIKGHTASGFRWNADTVLSNHRSARWPRGAAPRSIGTATAGCLGQGFCVPGRRRNKTAAWPFWRCKRCVPGWRATSA